MEASLPSPSPWQVDLTAALTVAGIAGDVRGQGRVPAGGQG